MTIGERLQQHRKDLGLSQEELGQQLHVSRQTVSQWETDQTLPTVDNLIRLKELFGVSIDSLLSKEGSFEKEPEETPRESYQFTFSEAELRLFYRDRMFATLKRPLISLLLILFLSIIFFDAIQIAQQRYSYCSDSCFDRCIDQIYHTLFEDTPFFQTKRQRRRLVCLSVQLLSTAFYAACR